MFRLFSRIPDGLVPIADIFKVQCRGGGCWGCYVDAMQTTIPLTITATNIQPTTPATYTYTTTIALTTPTNLTTTTSTLQIHITELGAEKIEQRLARVESAGKEGPGAGKEGPGASDKESNDDPQFIKDLLAVHDKYIGVVSMCIYCSLVYIVV